MCSTWGRPGFAEFGHVHRHRREAAGRELGRQGHRLGGQDDVISVAHRVQAEHRGIFVGGLDELGEARLEGGPASVVEGGRVVGGGARVEHAQRRVQVVEPGVHQAEADHRQPEQLLEFVPDLRVAAESVPGQDHPARMHDVPLTLVDQPRLVHRRETAAAEPVQVGGSFRGPLRVAELGPQDGAADDGGTVGREDHVRQAGAGVDELDRVAERAVGIAQQLPLEHGPGGVHRFPAGHPGVDGVLHREMVRRAHQVGPGPGQPGRHSTGRQGSGRQGIGGQGIGRGGRVRLGHRASLSVPWIPGSAPSAYGLQRDADMRMDCVQARIRCEVWDMTGEIVAC